MKIIKREHVSTADRHKKHECKKCGKAFRHSRLHNHN